MRAGAVPGRDFDVQVGQGAFGVRAGGLAAGEGMAGVSSWPATAPQLSEFGGAAGRFAGVGAPPAWGCGVGVWEAAGGTGGAAGSL